MRPAPVAVVGDIKHYEFDLKTCTFTVSIRSARPPLFANAKAKTNIAASEGEGQQQQPSVFFLPEFHFPRDGCVVETSGGKWEITADEGEVQRLRWWNGGANGSGAEQTLKVVGAVRRMNGEGGEGEGEEAGYYDVLSNWIGQGCSVM